MIKIRPGSSAPPIAASSLFVRPIQRRIQPHYQIIQTKMKLAIASLVLGSAAAFQPHSALNAVPKSSSALDMKVRFLFEQANECCITAGSSTIQGRKHDYDQTFEVAGLLRKRATHLECLESCLMLKQKSRHILCHLFGNQPNHAMSFSAIAHRHSAD